jgi:hypothetical protein
MGHKPGETVKISVGQAVEHWTISNLRRWVDLPR